ncbi:MAG: aldo/keto reductase [Betaproteobacteria bacterium]|nr:aldo/keto reductase [Betaproteobacteria bacterium]
MRYRLLGRTGLYVSELCLGTMTWGGKGRFQVVGRLGLPDAEAQLRTAFEAGVNFVDTADVYSEGESERILGQAIRNLGLPREDLVVATKGRIRMGDGANRVGLSRVHLTQALDASLTRLGLDHVDLYQVHGFDPVTPIDETLRALDDFVRAGKVRHIGVSNFAAWQIMKALGVSERRGLSRFESVQAYYSIAGRDLEREVVPMALDQQVGILVWSPLAGGLLSGKFAPDAAGPEGARRTDFDFPPVDRDRAFRCVAAMRPIADRHGTSVARVALAWTLRQPGITSVIIGAKTDAQLSDNLAASDLALTDDDLAQLDEASRLPPEYPGWMIAFQQRDRFPGGAIRFATGSGGDGRKSG